MGKIDRVNAMRRSGILAGGNWIVDHVKIIDHFPPQDSLANILHEATGNGGSAYNLLIDLSRLGVRFPLAGVGLVGHDDDGRHILDDCRAHHIDTAQLRQTEAAATSYTDYLFLNEYEAAQTTGLALTDAGEVQLEQAREAASRLIDLGVRAWVFQHFPDDVIAVNRDGDCVRHGSVQMPASAIVGTGGAGDALAAGILTGLHEGWDIAACLELGVCCAATSLREANCSGGVTPWQDALRFGRERGYHTLSA